MVTTTYLLVFTLHTCTCVFLVQIHGMHLTQVKSSKCTTLYVSTRVLSLFPIVHLNMSPSKGQGQTKTLARVGIKPTGYILHLH